MMTIILAAGGGVVLALPAVFLHYCFGVSWDIAIPVAKWGWFSFILVCISAYVWQSWKGGYLQ
jgi:hypothetical protein